MLRIILVRLKLKKKNIVWKKLDISKIKNNYFNYLHSPDIVINLAWPDIPNYRSKKHLKTLFYQKRLNFNLLKKGLKNLIILGTCYEYGKVNGNISEKKLCKPNTNYGKAKLKLLENLTKLQKNYNFRLAWLRPFFIYGENKKRKTLFSLLKEIDNGKEIKLKVCGNLVRDFLHVNFLCRIIFRLMKYNSNVGILNVCSGKKITVRQFIYNNLKNKDKLNYISMNGINPNSFEPDKFWGDTKKLNKIINKRK